MRDRFGGSLALLWLLACLVVTAATAAEQGAAPGYEAALEKFAGDSFRDTDEGIAAVAASGSPLAESVIGALQDGRLLFDGEGKKIYFRDAAGSIFEAATGRPIAGPEP